MSVIVEFNVQSEPEEEEIQEPEVVEIPSVPRLQSIEEIGYQVSRELIRI